ncbi:uncharacterized protein LOC121425249 [Lytechinus variegatus]|uniref:uncharacterized protein LOC121425249 n=1 Tax=Lytechinus variegatus TaxID=7654 RepID=UPI001BB23259|nr:uncharacterized protein LOC121425249 [Lytechinus variegatus]
MYLPRVAAALLVVLSYLATRTDAQSDYHGKLVGSFGATVHDVAGTIYAEDDQTIRIIGFSYDGTAPDAFLWGGETSMPTSDGFPIYIQDGIEEKLGYYSDVDITVTLPSSRSLADLNYISVWCREFAADFGHVVFPQGFEPPSPYNLGVLPTFSHRTSATAVTVLDPKRLKFEDLYYDGFGPDAYFWVGPGSTPTYYNSYRTYDETGQIKVLGAYSGQTITINLLENITVFDIGHIGLWCVRFREDFGHVDIPNENVLNIPPLPLPVPPTTTTIVTTTTATITTTSTAAPSFCNCETLDSEFEVCWYIDGDDIVIRHSTPSTDDNDGMYSAFGISGLSTRTEMVGGDVTVTFVNNGVPMAVDYYLDSKAQCSPQNGAGSCPDVLPSNPARQASDDVTLVNASSVNGNTHIIYRRPLAASDVTYDKAISTTGPTYVIWARGLINADGRVSYHGVQQRSPATSNLQIDFNRVSTTCAPETIPTPSNHTQTTPTGEMEGWTIEGIVEPQDATFTVEMGLTGGQKGYNYITGSVGWGIAWFINGRLIPELTLTRGKTYTFLVSGGDDPTLSAKYHPFYITDDPSGGYAQLSQAEQEEILIFAGPEEGPLCQWETTDNTEHPDSYASFDEFKSTLTVDCDPGDPGELVWTVPMDAPDILYYHCYTHRFLGWKIHLVDDAERNTTSQETTTMTSITTSVVPGIPTTTGSTTTIVPDTVTTSNPVQSDENTYHGKLVGSFAGTVHDVAGTIYAEDDHTIRIIGFSYDGAAPDAFLWGGDSGASGDLPTGAGFPIHIENGIEEKLGSYSNANITVTLPPSRTVSTLNYISVWCRLVGVDFGHVVFPQDFDPPSPYNLGALPNFAHQTSATAVIVLDPKRIKFEELRYDGFGPDAYFWVGPGDTPTYDNSYRTYDETGEIKVLKAYTGQTVTVNLIENITVFDIGHIGLWCVIFRQDFGHVDIPDKNVLNIPPLPLPTPPTTTPTTAATVMTTSMAPNLFCNCETLDSEFEVCWYIDGDDIVIRHSTPGTDGDDGMYSAFGISGLPTSTEMVGGDVVVTFIDNGVAMAVDYYLGSKAQCSPQNRAGSCPDIIASSSATNDVTLVESSRINGKNHISYRRPLAASDATYDKAFSTSEPTYVIWARGLINADGRVSYHAGGQRSPIESNLQIDFSQVSTTCDPMGVVPATQTTPTDEEAGWTIEGIVEPQNATFTVEMGLTGGQKGYNYITGSVGWGIAWFINGLLIPELTLTRGKTYTFLVSGGDDPTLSANYHPFYITDDPSGGYAQLSQAEQENIRIFAGPEEGPLCQWETTDDTEHPDSYASFEEFKSTLTVDCKPGDPGELVWTVPMDAPDILYYHCYTHRFLGWKIHLVDEEEETTSQRMSTSAGSATATDRVAAHLSQIIATGVAVFAALVVFLTVIGMRLRRSQAKAYVL